MKKLLKIVLGTIIVIILIFVISRYGWRLFGFSMCDSPEANHVEDIIVDDTKIFLSGGTVDSISAYVGYCCKREDDNLYIGIKHNILLGFINRLGNFNIIIKGDPISIQNIYFKNSNSERLVWNKKEGVIRVIPQEKNY